MFHVRKFSEIAPSQRAAATTLASRSMTRRRTWRGNALVWKYGLRCACSKTGKIPAHLVMSETDQVKVRAGRNYGGPLFFASRLKAHAKLRVRWIAKKGRRNSLF